MSFSSNLKGFYVSTDLDVILDKLTEDDEEICRIETCILTRKGGTKPLDSDAVSSSLVRSLPMTSRLAPSAASATASASSATARALSAAAARWASA